MIGADAVSRCPKSTHLTGPAGSDATLLGIRDQKNSYIAGHLVKQERKRKNGTCFLSLCDMYCLCTTRGQHAELCQSCCISHVWSWCKLQRSTRLPSAAAFHVSWYPRTHWTLLASWCARSSTYSKRIGPSLLHLRLQHVNEEFVSLFCETAQEQTIGLENIFKCTSWAIQLQPSSDSCAVQPHI